VVRLIARRARVDGVPEAGSATVMTGQSAELADVLETVAAALDSGVVLLDGHDVVLANDAALTMRVVRRTTLTSPVLARLVREARRSGQRVHRDVDLPWGAGWRPVNVTLAPVAGTERVVLLLRDLTEAHRVEAVRRDFVASVSHELKTPVGGLLLLAEAIHEAADDPVASRRFADRMAHEAGRLSQLVRDLLDLSRLQGGEPLPSPTAVDVGCLTRNAVDRVRVTADSAGVEIAVGDCDDLTVWGDERSLETALVNLLDNAINYSARRSRVAVGARTVAGDGADVVEISVADQGIGIAPEDLDRVFERFYRADPARSRRTGGTGLGLAIVKHVAENAGGRVSVWSQLGMGSTFTVHLPTPPTARVAPAPTTRPNGHLPESA
jgi:two-component system, OmpR family, sensor histidine kinase SenX3